MRPIQLLYTAEEFSDLALPDLCDLIKDATLDFKRQKENIGAVFTAAKRQSRLCWI